MKNIIAKVIVAQFYKINTGFFLVAFLLLFGLLNGKATMELHHLIMLRITASYWWALAAMAVWILYSIKCISFTSREISKNSNSFLFALQSVPDTLHFLQWFNCQALLLFPLLVYAGVTVVVGIGSGHYVLSVLFAMFQVALCFGGASFYYSTINNTWRKPRISIPHFSTGTKKGFFSYLINYSLTTRKGTFIGIKLFSLLLLQGMVAANAYEVNKESICVLIMFLVAAHSLLPVYYAGFIEHKMSFLRNMPIPLLKRFLLFVVTYAITLLPELLFLLLNGKHVLPLQLTISLYAVAISQLSLYTAIRYFNKLHTDRYFMVVSVFFFAFLLFLASFNLWILFFTEASVAVLLFLFLYPRHEAS